MRDNSLVSEIRGVGDKLAEKFAALGITTVDQLVEYFPRKYNDYSNVATINNLKPGVHTVLVSIKQATGRYVRGGLHITEAIASDATGSVKLVWFNQPYRAASIHRNEQYFVSGTFELRKGRLSFTNPAMELKSDLPVHTARIIPVYKETKGLKSTQIRKAIQTVFSNGYHPQELLPEDIRQKNALIDKREALYTKHFPSSSDELKLADRRLGFEELFMLISASLLTKKSVLSSSASNIRFQPAVAQRLVQTLPFELTTDQRKAAWRIFKDLEADYPMNRLLEGDVGSGKTVVAAMAAVMVIEAGYQVALMAPTELLAQQHARTLHELLSGIGYGEKVLLLTGSMKPNAKNQAHRAVADGKAGLIVGTHALIQEKTAWHNLGLVIVDEQHRFGVKQRKTLLQKAGHAPHMLSMTATPIPRSLALTVFGDMDISVIAEKPKSRQPIDTELVHPNDRQQVYTHIKQKLSHGEQMYVVCPLISDSSNLELSSAESTYEHVIKDFPDYNIGLLHGRLKSEQKDEIMQQFKDHKIDILVATTVIEVGVDVPNATTMIIEGPERFGLAQLHQLRGRVGRSHQKGHCYLMLSDTSEPSARLRAVSSTQDGFKLAELDLQLRGAGALYGNYQHGQLDLRIANFTDTRLIAEVRTAATKFIQKEDNLLQYPHIKQRIEQLQTVVHLN